MLETIKGTAVTIQFLDGSCEKGGTLEEIAERFCPVPDGISAAVYPGHVNPGGGGRYEGTPDTPRRIWRVRRTGTFFPARFVNQNNEQLR